MIRWLQCVPRRYQLVIYESHSNGIGIKCASELFVCEDRWSLLRNNLFLILLAINILEKYYHLKNQKDWFFKTSPLNALRECRKFYKNSLNIQRMRKVRLIFINQLAKNVTIKFANIECILEPQLIVNALQITA